VTPAAAAAASPRHAAPSSSWWKLAAAAAAFVVVGVGIGRAWPDTQLQQEVSFLRDELRSVRHVMTLSLIQQASATERLQAVATAALIDRPDAQVRDALLEALAGDGNVNVRLAAIDALRGLAGDPRVSAQLIASARDRTRRWCRSR
jgi:HEAT repeat protein